MKNQEAQDPYQRPIRHAHGLSLHIQRTDGKLITYCIRLPEHKSAAANEPALTAIIQRLFEYIRDSGLKPRVPYIVAMENNQGIYLLVYEKKEAELPVEIAVKVFEFLIKSLKKEDAGLPDKAQRPHPEEYRRQNTASAGPRNSI